MDSSAFFENLPKPTQAAIRSLGHRVNQWRTAADNLRRRVTNGKISPWLIRWFDAWPAHSPDNPNGTPHPQLNLFLTETTHPDPSLRWSPAADTSIDTWFMISLLRLPTLKTFWIRELKDATYHNLLNLFPTAWILDPTPPPPGFVLAHWNFTHWTQILQSPQIHQFALLSPTEKIRPITPQNLNQSLTENFNLLTPSASTLHPSYQLRYEVAPSNRLIFREIIVVAKSINKL